MVADSLPNHYKNSSALDFDLVYEKLSRYADYLEQLIRDKKLSACINGIQADRYNGDADLERGLS